MSEGFSKFIDNENVLVSGLGGTEGGECVDRSEDVNNVINENWTSAWNDEHMENHSNLSWSAVSNKEFLLSVQDGRRSVDDSSDACITTEGTEM